MLGRRQARSVAALGLALLLGAAACSTDRKVTEPPPEKITDDLLAGQLVTVDDLGDGFSEASEDAPIATEVLDDAKCDDKLAKVEAKADAFSAFENGDGVVVINQVAYLPGGDAGRFDALIDDIYEDCAKVVVAETGDSIRTLPLRFGSLTDNTQAMKIEIEPESGPIEERDYVLMRKGDLVSVVRVDGERPIDTQITDRAVRAAIGNLGTLANET